MSSEPPLEISVQAVQAMIARGEPFHLLDCRQPDEYAIARIEPARLISMDQIPARLAELSELRDDRIVVYCHHGVRSLMVVEFLRRHGFLLAQSMSGGIDAWSRLVDPDVPRYE